MVVFVWFSFVISYLNWSFSISAFCLPLLVSPPSLDCNGHTSMLSCNYNFPHFDSLVWINPTLTDFGILGSIFCMLKNRQSI